MYENKRSNGACGRTEKTYTGRIGGAENGNTKGTHARKSAYHSHMVTRRFLNFGILSGTYHMVLADYHSWMSKARKEPAASDSGYHDA